MRTDRIGDSVEVEPGVYLTQLSLGDRTSVQHARIEPGAEVPEHSHPHEQVGFVYEGELRFRVDGDAIDVDAGESYALASEEPHGAVNRGDEPALVIDVFSPPRADPDWAD